MQTPDNTMTQDHRALAADLLQMALDNTEHPHRAASVLVSAAATILQRLHGEEGALALLTQGLDATGAEWRRHNAN